VTPKLSLIVAASENGVIGRDGTLPWRIPEDMKRFKTLTMGKPLIMGRKTWDSLPKKPLPGRTNIVITRDRALSAPGAVIVHSFADALARARAEHPDEIMVIGGEAIFAESLPSANFVYLTQVHADIAGDARMPPLDPAHWFEAEREGPFPAGDVTYSFIGLERR
jgi:dihydrofolate reductase